MIEFSAQQQEVIESPWAGTTVLAGGRRSGKTQILLSRALRHPHAERCCLVVHTHQMIDVMRHRANVARLPFHVTSDIKSLHGRYWEHIFIDEASLINYKMLAVIPALSDSFTLVGSPNGLNLFWEAWKKAARMGSAFQFDARVNPGVSLDEFERFKHDLPDKIYQEQILGKFVGNRGIKPNPYPDEPGVWLDLRMGEEISILTANLPRSAFRLVSLRDVERIYKMREPGCWFGPFPEFIEEQAA